MPPELDKKPNISDPQRVLPDFLHSLVLEQILNFLYPVGTIYMTVVDKSPAALFGGIWVAWGSGRVPVGVDTSQTEFNTVEKTGGHKLLQSHSHRFKSVKDAANTNSNGSLPKASNSEGQNSGFGAWQTDPVENTGGGDSQNLQPYITCYIWKRTA